MLTIFKSCKIFSQNKEILLVYVHILLSKGYSHIYSHETYMEYLKKDSMYKDWLILMRRIYLP
jgi:hypothetical protein